MRLSRRNVTPVSETVEFFFDGRPISALPGESVAAALAANGITAFRQTGNGDKRGLYCGMGACFDCLVTIDGRASQRACLAKVGGGEQVRSTQPAGTPADPLRKLVADPVAAEIEEVETDILVIGAGPAGLSAALAAVRRGAMVVVLDERPQSGGQYFKPLAPSQRPTGPVDRQFSEGQLLVEAVRQAGARILQGAHIWGAFDPTEVLALVDGRALVLRPRRLILATGAYERAVPIPGWTLAGVMTSGAAQTLARSYGVAPGKRVVIAGNGPLNLQLAVELVDGGCSPAAVVESAPRPGLQSLFSVAQALATAPALMFDGVKYLRRLRQANVPVYWSHVATAAEGDGVVERLRIAPVAADGTPYQTNARSLRADAVCLGYGFVSSVEIARALGCRTRGDARHLGSLVVERSETGETSLPGVFVCGDGAEFAGAQAAKASGTLAGAAAAAQLGRGAANRDIAAASRALRSALSFQRALWRLFAGPPVQLSHIPDETLLCRCESLAFGKIRREIREGWDSLATLKRRTRLGMGRCQGRYCAPTAGLLLEEMTGRPRYDLVPFAPRLPAKPFPAAALSLEKREWGGYQRSPSPDLAHPTPAEPFSELVADVVVIGAGILGACVAYYLAKDGQDVLVVERDDANLQASGANAGSLHVQLLSSDFAGEADAGGGPAARTLPLGPWAIALWQEFAKEYGGFDISVTGGLMVADSHAGMAFLQAKAGLERRYGIQAEIVGQAELRKLAPALSEKLIGAEFAPQEGKIDPLAATLRVLDLARALGARYVRSANVKSLARNGARWAMKTTRGSIRAGKVINAAGPWAREVGKMAGLDVPVYTSPLQMIVTEPAPPLVTQLIAHSNRHLSLKQTATGGVLIGGAWPARYDEARRLNVTLRQSIEGNLWVAREVLPQISGLHVLRTWAGMNVNIDGAPIVGEVPCAAGFYNAVSSNGYTLAPAVANLCADLVLGRSPHIDPRPYSIERFAETSR